jgi:hypothetical protein
VISLLLCSALNQAQLPTWEWQELKSIAWGAQGFSEDGRSIIAITRERELQQIPLPGEKPSVPFANEMEAVQTPLGVRLKMKDAEKFAPLTNADLEKKVRFEGEAKPIDSPEYQILATLPNGAELINYTWDDRGGHARVSILDRKRFVHKIAVPEPYISSFATRLYLPDTLVGSLLPEARSSSGTLWTTPFPTGMGAIYNAHRPAIFKGGAWKPLPVPAEFVEDVRAWACQAEGLYQDEVYGSLHMPGKGEEPGVHIPLGWKDGACFNQWRDVP